MSNETEDRSPRLNRAVLIRIVAVLAFVSLGTFVVVRSVMTKKGDPDSVVQSAEQKEPLPDDPIAVAGAEDQNESPGSNDDSLATKVTVPDGNFASIPDNSPSTPEKNDLMDNGFPLDGKNGFDPPQLEQEKPNLRQISKQDLLSPPSGGSSFPAIVKSEPIKTARAPMVNSFNSAPTLPTEQGNMPESPAMRTAQLSETGSFGGPAAFGDMPQARKMSLPQIPDVNSASAFPNPNQERNRSTPDGGFKNDFSPAVDAIADSTRQKARAALDNLDDQFGGALNALRPDNLSGSNIQSAPQIPEVAPANQTAGTSFGTNEDLKPLRSTGRGGNQLGGGNGLGSDSKLANPSSPSSFNSANPSFGAPPSNPASMSDRQPIAETIPQLKTPAAVQDLRRPDSLRRPLDPRSLPVRPNNTPSNSGGNRSADSFIPTNESPNPLVIRNKAPARNVSNMRVPTASPPVSRGGGGGAGNTKSTPGDRQLEGAQAPSLIVRKVAPPEIQMNQPADFEIVVRNNGRVVADQVQVFDRIPEGTELLSATPQPQQESNGEVRWSLGNLSPGQEKRIKLQLRPTRTGEIGSVAHVTFAAKASMRTLVTQPKLVVTHSGPAKVLIGDDVVLDILVENRGDGAAQEVVIQEDVPEQLSFQAGLRELKFAEYEIGTLAPGQSRKVRLSLKAVKSGRLKNVLFASAKGDLREQHSIDIEVIAPQLITSGAGPSRRYLRRQATHNFTVENRGTANATNVELTAKLPRGLQFVNANNRGEYDANAHAVYWSLEKLTPNVAASVELTTTPIEAGDHEIMFDAAADLNQKSQAGKKLLVENLVDVFFDIDDQVDPIEIGSSTNYQVRLVNQGTIAATNVRMQIDFPRGITPTGVQGNLPNEIRGQQIIFAPISSLSPGDELKFTVSGKGVTAGDHRVALRMQTDGRQTPVSKEETTRVYNDRE